MSNFKNIKYNINSTYMDIDKYSDFLFNEYVSKNKKEIILVNVGTDRCNGDTFGPMTGSLLEERGFNVSFYGTLEKPIHALNIETKLESIFSKHNNPFIIAADSSVAERFDVGDLVIENTPLKPGAAANKDLPKVGDVTISFVAAKYHDEYFIDLQNVRLGNILKASKIFITILERFLEKVSAYNNSLSY